MFTVSKEKVLFNIDKPHIQEELNNIVEQLKEQPELFEVKHRDGLLISTYATTLEAGETAYIFIYHDISPPEITEWGKKALTVENQVEIREAQVLTKLILLSRALLTRLLECQPETHDDQTFRLVESCIEQLLQKTLLFAGIVEPSIEQPPERTLSLADIIKDD